MPSPDKEFNLVGGNSESSSLHNRISAIDRMEYILKEKYGRVFSFRQQTSEWLSIWDMEMYQKWYKTYPKDHKIDEEFCQRGAEVANDMIKDALEVENALVDINKRIKQSYAEYNKLGTIDIPIEKQEVDKPIGKNKESASSFLKRIKKDIKNVITNVKGTK